MAMKEYERQEEREWSEASSKLGKDGWKAYMYARLSGTEHYAALAIGFDADIAAHRAR